MVSATLKLVLGEVSAAHRLPNHEGKCSSRHGHNYKVEVWLHGTVRPADGTSSEGMVLDFGDVKDYWRDNIEPFIDHQDLNVVLADEYQPPTAEHLAAYILERFVFSGYPVVSVAVWETANAMVQVSIDDLQ